MAVIEVSPTALTDAAKADMAYASGKPCRALEGVPVLVKDLFSELSLH